MHLYIVICMYLLIVLASGSITVFHRKQHPWLCFFIKSILCYTKISTLCFFWLTFAAHVYINFIFHCCMSSKNVFLWKSVMTYEFIICLLLLFLLLLHNTIWVLLFLTNEFNQFLFIKIYFIVSNTVYNIKSCVCKYYDLFLPLNFVFSNY